MKLLLIFGTRPEAIKMAPFIKTLQDKSNLHAMSVSRPKIGKCSIMRWLPFKAELNMILI